MLTIKSFTDLITWKEGHKLVLLIYKITKNFPSEERYSLVDQMRRASVSITSNVAEGFSRHSLKEKTQFYYMAKASLVELQNQMLVARDVGYLEKKDFDLLANQSVLVHKLINGLIKKLLIS
jgi:four helix bundle protein